MKVGERGQLTIPKQLRDRYGLYPNVEVELIEEHGQIILRRAIHVPQPDAWANVVGMLRNAVQDIDRELDEMRGR